MKKLLKALGLVLLAILAVPVVFYVFLLLYNLRDDALDPGVEKLLAAAPPQIAAADNGYFAWIGIGGPEAEDPHAWGRRWIQEALEADKKQVAPTGSGPVLAIEAERRRETLQAKDIPCQKLDTCLEAVATDPTAARSALAKGRVTLERGDAALAYPAYREAWRPDYSVNSPLVSYSPLWRHLTATRFALAVAEGNHDEAVDHLGREMAFHTRQLQGANTLIEKMVAFASLRADYQLLNQYLLRQPDAARPRTERIAALLAPPPADALRLQSVLMTESRFGFRLLLSVKDQAGVISLFGNAAVEGGDRPDFGAWLASGLGDTLGGALLLPHATVNEYSTLQGHWLAAEGLADAAYRQALTQARQQAEATAQRTFVLRNPVGHILNVIATPAYERYFLRRDDLLALRAATAFQLDLLRRGITAPDAIAQALPAAGLAHPYTGDLPTWDQGTRTLTYAALPERNDKPLAIAF